MKTTYECSFIDDFLSETDDVKKENMIIQLKSHLCEMEKSSHFIDDLREKFSLLQEEFDHLSTEKRKIEVDLSRKITQLTKQVSALELENEEVVLKYQSSKQKVKSITATHRNELDSFRVENSKLKKEKEDLSKDIQDLIKENDKLIGQINYYYSHQGYLSDDNDNQTIRTEQNYMIETYQKQIAEANDSIGKMTLYIKDLEQRNDNLTIELAQMPFSNHKEIITGLKKVITEKEKTISTLYNNYDRLNIQLEDSISKNEELTAQIQAIKNQFEGKEDYAESNYDSNDQY